MSTEKKENAFLAFLKRKNILFSAKRYGIDALGAMAQGLFASLLIGTIIATLGEQIGSELLVEVGGYAKAVSGPAMAVAMVMHCRRLRWYCFPCLLLVLQPIRLAAQAVLWQF